ncbi:MAG: YheU family protein [Deltaproteobacteria bacterium]|nr:YheU family protein [Deltaproteobacteria bacterium]
MNFVQIPLEALSPEALDNLIEEFVTRDGTDYGATERSLDDKKRAVVRQLHRGEVLIVFDPETQTSNLLTKEELHARTRTV